VSGPSLHVAFSPPSSLLLLLLLVIHKANGAYYYYNPNGTYADTLVRVVDSAREIGLPLQWLALDSWWYPKGAAGGVLEWEPQPGGDAFPDGLAAFRESVGGLPFMMHNRHWSANNVYATQNGGAYPFWQDNQSGMAIPLSQQFWDDLIANHTKVGLAVYLQDWCVRGCARVACAA
jgi:hypothetical protein